MKKHAMLIALIILGTIRMADGPKLQPEEYHLIYGPPTQILEFHPVDQVAGAYFTLYGIR